MKKTILNLFAIGMIVGLSNNVMAQNSATVSDATASATLIAPITITEGTQMNFGGVIKAAGTVTLTNGGVRSSTNLNHFAISQFGTVTAASFNIGGEGLYTYSISLPTTISITDQGVGVGTMVVNNFTTTSPTGALDGDGLGTVLVGADLIVLGTEETGLYSGTYSVTVAYN